MVPEHLEQLLRDAERFDRGSLEAFDALWLTLIIGRFRFDLSGLFVAPFPVYDEADKLCGEYIVAHFMGEPVLAVRLFPAAFRDRSTPGCRLGGPRLSSSASSPLA